MNKEPRHHIKKDNSNTTLKEFLIGLFAIALGGYNLLTSFGIINFFVHVPQIVGNIILVLAGLLLWITAFKLYRHKYHTNRLF